MEGEGLEDVVVVQGQAWASRQQPVGQHVFFQLVAVGLQVSLSKQILYLLSRLFRRVCSILG